MHMIEDSTPTRTRGPEPVVCFGKVLQSNEHPGVLFVLPSRADTIGGAQSAHGYAIPLVVVTEDRTVAEVMAAALAVGESFSIKQQMRAAVKRWARSEDWRRNPHVPPSEWATA